MNQKNNREILKRLLVEFREDGIPDSLKERRFQVNKKKGEANVLTGIRRSGKTYRMFQIIRETGLDKCYYINFEDERIINPTVEDLSNVLPLIEETFETQKPIYLFIDEIQNVDGWEKWARRLAERDDVIIFLTGSSSKLSSREIASSLRGRTLVTHVFPLSFREFLDFKDIELDLDNVEYSKNKPRIRRYFNNYLKYGGFPEIVLEEEEKKKLQILREYFSTIVARDIIERYSIDKTAALESFMKLLVNNFSRLISFTKSRNWLKSMGIKISKNTLKKYFDYMKSSYFLFDTTIYSESVKDRLQYPRKVYLIDNGFATALTERFSSDRRWFFENLVAVNLYRQTIFNPKKELHYWKKNQKEVDFILKSGINVEELIQVCSNMNEDTKRREIKNLLMASEDLNCDNLTVITDDVHKSEEIEGKEIQFIPLWLKLLER